MQRSLLAKFALLLTTVTLCLAAIEGYLRWQFKIEHDLLIERNSRRELISIQSEVRELIYTYNKSNEDVNSHGYIDYEYALEKPKNTFRIVLIGDSVAQGQGVHHKESFPKRFEFRLNELDLNVWFEVIVLARTGYSTVQELWILENEAFDYDPDLIIWNYVLNDPAHPVFHNANGELGRYYYQPRCFILHYILKDLFARHEKKFKDKCPRELHPFLFCAYWPQIESEINDIGSICRDYDTPVVFLIMPLFEREGPGADNFNDYSLTYIHEQLKQTSNEAGMVALDILDAFRGYRTEQIKIHFLLENLMENQILIRKLNNRLSNPVK